MEKEITLTFTEKELEDLNYSLNSAAIHAHDIKLFDWASDFNRLWCRIYEAQKSL